MKRAGSKGELLFLAIIVLVAVFFRAYALDKIPGGLSNDEALWGFQAARVASGEIRPIFFEEGWGREPMHGYLVAIMFGLFGANILALRATTVLVGVATVPIYYLLAKELFVAESSEESPSVIAMLSTSWLATSYWHVIYSRGGLEDVLLPLFAVVTFYFMWQGIRSNRRLWFACAGFFLGASLYTYQASKFLPIFVLLFLVYLGWRDRQWFRSQCASVVLLLTISLQVAAPLAIYAATNPETFWHRAQSVSIFNPEVNEGNPVRAFGTACLKAAAIFNLHGDPYPERNPGRRPILDPLTSVFFLAGLAIAVLRTREREYAFVWLWLFTMSLPGALTVLETPNFTRALGALPAVYLLPAIAVAEAYQGAQRWLDSTRLRAMCAIALLFIPVTFAALATYHDYFGAYARRDDLPRRFDLALIEATNVMNQTHIDGAVWIWPTTSFVSGQHIFSHPDFLYHGTSPYRYLSCDDKSGADDLTTICQGARTALVLEWKGYVQEKAYEAIAADPKGLISFLFHKYGRELDRRSYEAFDVVTYKVPESPAFSIADNFEPLTVNFGGELMLIGMDFGGSSLQDTSTPQDVESRKLPSGKDGWVVLQWRALADLEADYKVAVYLLDSHGRVVGQTDKLLLSNYLDISSRWEANQLEMDYYILSCRPATSPGKYTVQVAVYDAGTMDRLSVFDAETGAYTTSIAIGELQVIKPSTPAEVQPQWQLPSSQVSIAPGLQLLGYDMPVRAASPGETVRVALYWRATEDVSRDYLVSLQLKDDHGEPLFAQQDRPVDDTYPTTEWGEGEVLRDWHDLSLRADMPQGEYDVLIQVLEGENPVGEASLGQIELRGRAREFDEPQIQHAQEATLGETVMFLETWPKTRIGAGLNAIGEWSHL